MTGMFYVSGWVLTTQFLVKRKNIALFIVSSLTVIVVFSFLRVRLLRSGIALSPDTIAGYLSNDSTFQAGRALRQRILHSGGFWKTGRLPYLTGFIIGVVILVIAMLIRLYDHKTQREQESQEKLQHSQEAQIVYLKSQVNPHFLFNTLNNLYGLTYSKSDLAPQMVLGLSETMRYMIYETEQKLVPVEKELDFIRNYLDLEKMRISQPDNIHVSIHISHPGAFIPPLILLPFIENCFKHGSVGKEDDGWMELDIWDEDEQFYFICKNNFSPNETIQTTKTGKTSGLGLSNVRKRLDLIFVDRYELRTVKKTDEFLVSLQFPVFSKKADL